LLRQAGGSVLSVADHHEPCDAATSDVPNTISLIVLPLFVASAIALGRVTLAGETWCRQQG